MTTNITATKISATLLPTQLRQAFKDNGPEFAKRDVCIRIHHSNTMQVKMFNTRWDGGTRTEYRSCRIEEFHSAKEEGYVHSLPYSISNGLADGTPLTAFAGFPKDECVFFIESGFFCGKPMTPVIHIMDCDVAQFFGMGGQGNMPSAIFADWIDEQYDNVKATHGSREANRQRKIAQQIRKANGV